MNLEFLARQSGVDIASVLEHKRIGRTDILRIDQASAPALRRPFAARAEGIFKADITADGLYRDFPVQFIDAFITDKFEDEVGPEEVWKLGGETYPPDSLFGIDGERIDFNVFERHNGKQFDLSIPNEHWSRPWVAWGLADVHPITGEFFWIWTQPASGWLEVHLETPVDNTRHLAGVFRDVHFDVPNLHLFFPQAPNRPFVVDIANGHYGITGTW